MKKELLPYIYDDGGRFDYFKGKQVGDCVCRAITIASGRDYKEIYDIIHKAMGESPRNGVYVHTTKFKRLMKALGFVWVSCCKVGSTESTHFYKGELPMGRLVCSVRKHMVAVIDGVVRDTWDSRYNSFSEPRRIYGYWLYKKEVHHE